MSTEKNFLTAKEAAGELRIATSTLYKMVSENKIPFYKPNGKRLYFMKAELEKWIEQGKSTNHED